MYHARVSRYVKVFIRNYWTVRRPSPKGTPDQETRISREAPLAKPTPGTAHDSASDLTLPRSLASLTT